MTILDHNLLIRLLGSIEANRLVILCGAGLSIPAPSNLMSAVRVAQTCYDKWTATQALPPNLRDDIDLLAAHFHAQGQFVSVFIGALVPWNELVGEPNEGHAAVSDLLISRAANAALSANFDPLVEQWAERRKIAMQGALDGAEALAFVARTNPLLKFHGCLHRRREQTLWTRSQLPEQEIEQRIASCVRWMNLTLPGKDLLIVGFWSDWRYLNDVLAQTISITGIGSVTVVDPATTAQLQVKAPALWDRLTSTAAPFQHVQASGVDALDELRLAFSKVWARKFFRLGKPVIESAGGIYPVAIESLAWQREDIYNLRRDAEGVPYNRAAQKKEPGPEAAQAAVAHILLIQANATCQGAWYHHGGRTVRIVQGGGQALATVRERYNEPPSTPPAEIVICAGANDIHVPGKVISAGQGASIIRPAPGGGSLWLTLDQARAELAI